MSWAVSEELERLLNALADGVVDEADEARIAEILRGDAAARRYYRQWQGLHAALMWDYAAAASATSGAPEPPPRRWREAALLAAAIALVTTLAILWFAPAGKGAIATVKMVQGAVAWSDGSGGSPLRLAVGSRLRAGAVVAEGGASAVTLCFNDGSLVTLSGDAELAFFDGGQKQLNLRRGSLTAQVEHQPPGRPMQIATSAAEIEVVGTVFDLTAASTETALNVGAGRVKLRRLVDNKTVEVGAQQGVVASLSATELAPSLTKVPPVHWRRSYEAPPPPTNEGRWMPASGEAPARERAVACVAGRKENGALTIHYGVGIRAATAEPCAFAALSSSSVLRFRYRTARPTGLKCFVSCRQPGGAFGGNFELAWPEPDGPPEAGGWRRAELPFSAAHAVMPDAYPALGAVEVGFLLIHSYEEDAGLEISEVEIAPGGGAL